MMICNQCHSQTVMLLNAGFVCDCNVRSMAKIASPQVSRSLRRAVAFQRGESPRCDRCNNWDATRLVRCYLGCSHAQCALCADCTFSEATEGRRWDASQLNGFLAGPRPDQPLHPPGKPDDSRELARRLT
jgi:hypothetical protein